MNTTFVYLLEKASKAAALAVGMYALASPFSYWPQVAMALLVAVSVTTDRLTKGGWYAFPSNAAILVKVLIGLCLGPMKVLASLFAIQAIFMLFTDPFFTDRTMALMLIAAVLMHEAAMMLVRFGRWQHEGRPS